MKRLTAIAAALLLVAPAHAGSWDIVRPPGTGWKIVGTSCDHAPVNPEPSTCPKPGPLKQLVQWARPAGIRGKIHYYEFTSTHEGWTPRVDPLKYAVNCDLWEQKLLGWRPGKGDKYWRGIAPGSKADSAAKIACGVSH